MAFSRFESQLQISIQRINAYSAVFLFIGPISFGNGVAADRIFEFICPDADFVLTSKDLIINHLEGKSIKILF